MTCGIYKITNKLNNQSYIGQSVHIEQRWKEHLNGKGNKPLLKDILSYGIENFQFEILEICEIDELNNKEEYWINYYDTYNNGYNLNAGGSNNDQAINKTKKTIYCYDLNGNFLAQYNSLAEAERITGINNSNISRAAKNQGRTKDYQWTYEYQPSVSPYERKNTNKGKYTDGKEVNQYDKNGNLIATYKSIHEAGRLSGANSNAIGEICNTKGLGRRKTSGGYVWRFKGDDF